MAALEGDPLDVLLVGSRKATGAVVRSRIVGVLYLEDEKGLDSKLIAVPASSSIRRPSGSPRARPPGWTRSSA